MCERADWLKSPLQVLETLVPVSHSDITNHPHNLLRHLSQPSPLAYKPVLTGALTLLSKTPRLSGSFQLLSMPSILISSQIPQSTILFLNFWLTLDQSLPSLDLSHAPP